MPAGRRSNGEGSVRQRPNGRWEGRIAYTDNITGLVTRTSVYGATKAEVRAKLKKVLERLGAGQPATDARITVGAWCEQWMATTLEASSRRPTTKDLSRSLLRGHVVPTRLGEVTLDRLRPSHVDAWLLELRSRTRTVRRADGTATTRRALAESSIVRCYQVLRVALDGAVRDGLLAANPLHAVPQPSVERHEARFLTEEELRTLLEALRGTRFHTLFTLIAATAMRKGEATALRWSDVDLDAGIITVRSTLARSGRALVLSPPKTTRSRRLLAPVAEVIEMLRALHRRQAAERLAAGDLWDDRDFVFTTATGAPLDPRNVLRALQNAARSVGLEGVTVHSLRHSAATAMLDAGVHLRAVSEILGHAGTQVTADIYSHVTTATARKAMNSMGGVLGLR